MTKMTFEEFQKTITIQTREGLIMDLMGWCAFTYDEAITEMNAIIKQRYKDLYEE